jgi:dihydroxyacetone kinase-like predicted kinase
VHPLPEGRQDHQGRLTTLLEGAIAHLGRNRAKVNELNVFPVADGDTGDNLLATLRAFRDGGARGALLGARGNSGVILSQLLAGLVDGGPQEAVRRAYAAVPDPVEGTMLTVARDMAAAEDLQEALVAGRESVRRGPSLLPALREAGVVDAGGYALTLMVAGALAALRGEDPPPEPAMAAPRLRRASRYRFCTNVALRGDDPDAWIAPLRRLGDSVMVVGDGGILRAHVHTDDPDAVVALLGDVIDVDISDMAPPTTAFALADDGFEELFASMGVRTVSELSPAHMDCVVLIAEPQAALVAAVALDPQRDPRTNSAAMLDALARVRTASVPAGGALRPAIEALAPGAELLTVLKAADSPLKDEEIRALVPAGIDVDVTPGAPPPWWWLIAAE